MAVEVRDLTKVYVKYVYKKFAVPMNYIPFLYFYYKIAEKTGQIVKEHVTAIDSVSFNVDRGEILAVLGPNGSGKTTLLRTLVGLTQPTGGKIFLDGEDVTEDPETRRRKFMYIPGIGGISVFVDKALSVKDNLKRFAEFSGVPEEKVEEALEVAGLGEVADSFLYDLSTGYQARLAVAMGIMRDADVYLLDEPFLGLSHEAKLGLIEYFKKRLAGEAGKTVIIATNTLEDAERLAESFLFLVNGRVVEKGSMESLTRKLKLREKVKMKIEGCGDASSLLEKYGVVRVENSVGDSVEATLYIENKDVDIVDVMEELVKKGCRIRFFSVEPPSLEDVYMSLYGSWKTPFSGEQWGCYLVM